MALPVDDYDAAIEFLVGALNFDLVEDSPGQGSVRTQWTGPTPAARRSHDDPWSAEA